MNVDDDEYGEFADNWEILMDIERAIDRGDVAEGLWRALGLHCYLSTTKDLKNSAWIAPRLDALLDRSVTEMCATTPMEWQCAVIHG